MKRSERLLPVVDVAVKKTEIALSHVGVANTAWLQDKQQLEDLYRYKDEYLAKFRQGNSMVMSAQKVLELRRFLAQLDQAIKAQQQQVQARHDDLTLQRDEWKKVRMKEKAMTSLVDRYLDEEVKQEVKKEQRDNDERNTLLWRQKLH